MSLKEKLQMWAWILGFVVATGVISHCALTQEKRNHLDKVVAEWKRDYHLSDDQAKRIRALEQEFHGSGDPLFGRAHTQAETRNHHRTMAGVMNPEDGERFLRAQEGRHATDKAD